MSWHNFFTAIAVVSEISWLIADIVTGVSSGNFILGAISIAVFALVGTAIYETKKASNHRETIKQFLEMEDEIIRLESLVL